MVLKSLVLEQGCELGGEQADVVSVRRRKEGDVVCGSKRELAGSSRFGGAGRILMMNFERLR